MQTAGADRNPVLCTVEGTLWHREAAASRKRAAAERVAEAAATAHLLATLLPPGGKASKTRRTVGYLGRSLGNKKIPPVMKRLRHPGERSQPRRSSPGGGRGRICRSDPKL